MNTKNEESKERTHLAEDRTHLAVERTFAAWTRTAFASVALGIGFQAVFQAVEPTWVAKLIATLFISVGVYLIWIAERSARESQEADAEIVARPNFLVIAIVVTVGAGLLLMAVWFLM